jgi:hypothetical protein
MICPPLDQVIVLQEPGANANSFAVFPIVNTLQVVRVLKRKLCTRSTLLDKPAVAPAHAGMVEQPPMLPPKFYHATNRA